VACGCGIVTVNSPSGSTLQSDTWLWDDMPLNSPRRPAYWNSTSGFDFDHITAVDMSFCTSFRNFIRIGPSSAEKNDVISIFKMADLSHLGFSGSNIGFFEKPNYNLGLPLLSFPENRVFCILATDRQTNKQTDEQMDRIDALSRSRCRERRLNKKLSCRKEAARYSAQLNSMIKVIGNGTSKYRSHIPIAIRLPL